MYKSVPYKIIHYSLKISELPVFDYQKISVNSNKNHREGGEKYKGGLAGSWELADEVLKR